MDYSKNKQNEVLGVNKIGKNIKKSPLHQPNFGNIPSTQQPQPQPQPQVYNINKNDFRNIVQQLTGSSQEPSSRPPQNPAAKQQSLRLQRIRPPPLTPINRPRASPPIPVSIAPPQVPYYNGQFRSAQCDQSSTAMFQGQPAPTQLPQPIPADSVWPKPADSPISAYMRYLQSSAIDSPLMGNQAQALQQAQVPGQIQNQVAPSGSSLPPDPTVPTAPSSTNGGPVPSLSNFPPIQSHSPAIFPSPTQFHVPSPSSYLNLLSPQSPYPLLSPGIRFPPPLSPNFAFSPMAQPGILGPVPLPPLSPGLVFPLSPSGLFPLLSPRWRDW
ncbi:protein HAIKU1 [Cucumis sativus]|uniref:VQ domain-containing protein n=1 Tax=Cucumis sativus TaxID=3659 RepID=A0A0A0LI32_CUCSA|nr:protein HAIKU1 [Cucumis sativus]KGN60387.1 hypothetical protein Csa_001897 [Cucumis sativus]